MYMFFEHLQGWRLHHFPGQPETFTELKNKAARSGPSGAAQAVVKPT